MKKVEAIFKLSKLEEMKEALAHERIQRFSIFEVKGAGDRQVRINQYRGVAYAQDSEEVGFAVITEDDDADRIAQRLVTTLQSNHLCDGEVVVLPVEKLFRVRVGKCA